MLFIFLGCITFGFFVSYIFTKWAAIKNFTTGMKTGADIGLFTALMSNFFMRSSSMEVDYKNILLDIVISLITGTIVGALVAFINDKLTDNT